MDANDTAAYGPKEHMEHMRAAVAAALSAEGGVATAGDLLGRADPGDDRLVMLTKNFASSNRGLGVRGQDIDRELAARRRAARAKAREAALQAPSSPADCDAPVARWVAECLDSWGLRVDARGRTDHPELNARNAMDALTILNSALPKSLRHPDGAVRASLDRALAERRLDRLDQIRRSVAHRPEDEAAAALLLGDVLTHGLAEGGAFTAGEAALLVRKFIWQCKRKLFGLPVSRHTMLVLVGAQGGGKSELVRRLVEPMEEVSVSIDLRTLTDERTADVFEQCYVGVVDELDKSERASVETLKRIITESKLDRRVMRTNGTATYRQNLSFIGTSNRDVAEAIVDETGNRRFVSLQVIGAEDPGSRQFWDAVNAMDWPALWRAVDERGDDPTLPVLDKIAGVQRTERARSNIELWVEHRGEEQPGLRMWSKWQSTHDLFENYKLWETLFAPRAETSFGWWSRAFARMARQRLVPFEAKREPGTGRYGYVATTAAAPGGEGNPPE